MYNVMNYIVVVYYDMAQWENSVCYKNRVENKMFEMRFKKEKGI